MVFHKKKIITQNILNINGFFLKNLKLKLNNECI